MREWISRQFLSCLLTSYCPSKSKRLGKASKEALSHVGPDLSGNQNPPIAANQNHTQALGSKAKTSPTSRVPQKPSLCCGIVRIAQKLAQQVAALNSSFTLLQQKVFKAAVGELLLGAIKLFTAGKGTDQYSVPCFTGHLTGFDMHVLSCKQ